ncbi:MAG TPA: hypothetical protein PK677_11350 [Acidiphilium sp.]|nr:hypothetical protein [Acidiphilium sp.]
MTPAEIEAFTRTTSAPVIEDIVDRSQAAYAAWTMATAMEGYDITYARQCGFVAMAAAQEMDIVLRAWRD